MAIQKILVVDDDPGVLISLCLFGDGASASLWRGEAAAAASPWRAEGFRSLHQPEHREKIRFVSDTGKLKNQLHRSVPALESLFNASFLPRDIYLISRMPSDPQSGDIVPIAVIALVLSFLATLYPSWRASRVNPAEALRYE